MAGIPQNYSELKALHGGWLEEEARKIGCSLDYLISELERLQTLERFDSSRHLPRAMSHTETINYLGLSPHQWFRLTQMTLRDPDWTEVRPNLVEGVRLCSRQTIYWGPDIVRIESRIHLSRLPRRTRILPGAVLEAFCRHVRIRLFLVWKWPSGLPKNNTQVVSSYGGFVKSLVAKMTRACGESLNEFVQDVWCRLLSAKCLDRYVDAIKVRPSRTVGVAEILSALSITRIQWRQALWKSKRDPTYWIPRPVEGRLFSLKARYLVLDIETLAKSSYFVRDFSPKAPLWVAKQDNSIIQGFRSYLSRAVINHLKNVFRTRDRRHKERPLSGDALVVLTDQGTHETRLEDSSSSWDQQFADREDIPSDVYLSAIEEVQNRVGCERLEDLVVSFR
jgi:hypothetical protein